MKKTGFTLIEVIIVVAIMGILAAIVVPLVTGNSNLLVQNGTICEAVVPGSNQGMVFSVSQGYRTQLIGTDGLPVGCEVK